MDCNAKKGIRNMTKALTIAGSDCSGGAGIQADLKTFSALGVFCMTAIKCTTIKHQGLIQRILTEQAAHFHLRLQHRLVCHVISEKVIYEGREYEGTIKIDRMWSHYEKI